MGRVLPIFEGEHKAYPGMQILVSQSASAVSASNLAYRHSTFFRDFLGGDVANKKFKTFVFTAGMFPVCECSQYFLRPIAHTSR